MPRIVTDIPTAGITVPSFIGTQNSVATQYVMWFCVTDSQFVTKVKKVKTWDMPKGDVVWYRIRLLIGPGLLKIRQSVSM